MIDDEGMSVEFVQDGTRLRVYIAGEEWLNNRDAASVITRQQIELDAWRDGRLYQELYDSGDWVSKRLCLTQKHGRPCAHPDTIDAAVDALVAEGE